MDRDFTEERRISTKRFLQINEKFTPCFICISTFALSFSLSEHLSRPRTRASCKHSGRRKTQERWWSTFLGPAPKSEFPDIWQSLWPIQPATHHRSDKPPHSENRIDKNSRSLSLSLPFPSSRLPFLFRSPEVRYLHGDRGGKNTHFYTVKMCYLARAARLRVPSSSPSPPVALSLSLSLPFCLFFLPTLPLSVYVCLSVTYTRTPWGRN